jgi:hypothetical protein
MTTNKPNSLVRLLPSLTDVAFLMPVALLFLRLGGANRLLGDGDTGWHLRAGEWILANGRVPQADLFSYTKAGEPWFAWEWLWDVVFAWFYRHGGMALVVLASLLVLSATFALLFRLVLRHSENVLIAFAVTFAATAGSTCHWLARPHVFTLLFVVIYCWVLEDARRGQVRRLWWLAPLMVIWTNLHGGFFVGILLIGCYAAGELAQWLVERDPAEASAALARSKPYLWTAAAAAVATLANPYGYRLHQHMYTFLTGTFHLQYISEYRPTDFQNNVAPWYEPMLLLGVIAAAWCLYRRRFAQGFLVAGWLHLGLYSVRNLPIYLLIAAPVVAAMTEELLSWVATAPLAAWVGRSLQAFERFCREFGENDRLPRWHAVSAMVFVLTAAVFYAPTPPERFRAEYDPKKYPEAALSVLADRGPLGTIFADDEWGDYLIYRMYPEAKVFVDGRFDLYGESFTKKYLDVLNARYGWQETLDRYGVDTVLLRVDTPLAGALKESARWRPVYDDGMAIVFRGRRGGQDNPRATGAAATDARTAVAAIGPAHGGERSPQADLMTWRGANE